MGVNKVVYDGKALIDLTNDTVTPETLAEGITAHDASGERITGTMKSTTENTIPDYWEEHLADKISTIKALQDEGGKDCFSFVVMADMHYPQNLGKISPLLAKRIMDECNIRYALVLGDIQSRGQHKTKADADSDWVGTKEMFSPIAENVLYQKGNHDGSWGSTLNGATYPYNFTNEEMYNRVYAPTYKYHDAVTDESGTGYYIDDPIRKVRYIMLNTHCNEYALNEDGSAKYNNMGTYRFTQSQYDFVVEALTSLQEGWGVLIGAHAPINNAYGKAFGDETNTTGDHIIMRNLLKAYKNKTAYSGSWDGTAGGSSTGGYTNLFSTSGSGFTQESSTKFYTNWIPYNRADNGGVGTIYHISGGAKPYKFHYADDENGSYGTGSNGTSLAYATTADQKANVTSDYDSSVTLFQDDSGGDRFKYIRFEFRVALPDNFVITANEEIKEPESTVTAGYDAVSVNADFTNAKGDFIGYFSGHMHNDYVYPASGYGVDIITTRCDGANENNSTLLAERVAGTITEQSFDVFTVNKATRTIHATKIGAGADREISY